MRAFIVVGPESSGNRFLVNQLASVGCFGRSGHQQPYDLGKWNIQLPETGKPENLVFHRSFPHGGVWPDLSELIQKLRTAGYTVSVFVMVRDTHATALSQVARGNVTNIKHAHENIQYAYLRIFQALIITKCQFLVIPFASLGQRRFTDWLLKQFHLPLQPIYQLFDQGIDEKYTVQPNEVPPPPAPEPEPEPEPVAYVQPTWKEKAKEVWAYIKQMWAKNTQPPENNESK